MSAKSDRLLDTAIAATSHKSQDFLISGAVPPRFGTASSKNVLAQAVRCQDGLMVVQASTDEQFSALCEALGRPGLAKDPRFSGVDGRIAHKEDLIRILETEVLCNRTVDEWVQALASRKVICAPIHNIEQALADPQAVHRGMTVSAEHSLAGSLRMIANPLRFSETPVKSYSAPPLLGQHTHEVLTDLGIDDVEIQRLCQAGAI